MFVGFVVKVEAELAVGVGADGHGVLDKVAIVLERIGLDDRLGVRFLQLGQVAVLVLGVVMVHVARSLLVLVRRRASVVGSCRRHRHRIHISRMVMCLLVLLLLLMVVVLGVGRMRRMRAGAEKAETAGGSVQRRQRLVLVERARGAGQRARHLLLEQLAAHWTGAAALLAARRCVQIVIAAVVGAVGGDHLVAEEVHQAQVDVQVDVTTGAGCHAHTATAAAAAGHVDATRVDRNAYLGVGIGEVFQVERDRLMLVRCRRTLLMLLVIVLHVRLERVQRLQVMRRPLVRPVDQINHT